MSHHRIWAILLQEFYITKRSLEVIMDWVFFSIISVTVFGFVNIFLVRSTSPLVANYILLGVILWEIIRITQYSVTLGALWNVWSRNLSNIFVSPISLKEYFFSYALSATIKGLITFVGVSALSAWLFDFNILSLGLLNLVIFFVNLTIFSWSVGIALLGLIFRFGTRIQAFAWSLVFLFQPLSAAFFPLQILPSPLKEIAHAFPTTYVFESARKSLEVALVNWEFALIAFAQNVVYLILSIWFFNYMFKKSKETGQFARNEG